MPIHPRRVQEGHTVSLSPAERFARYMHQPLAWWNAEDLADWHTARERWYRTTTEWTDQNRHAWLSWLARTP